MAYKKKRKQATTDPAKDLEIARRDRTVMELLEKGWKVKAIAEHIGVSLTITKQSIDRVLAEELELTAMEREHYRLIESHRLDRAMRALEAKVDEGDVPAIQAYVKLSESRRKMLGLDAPEKQELTGAGGTPLAVFSLPAPVQKGLGGMAEWTQLVEQQQEPQIAE